ncbi:GAP family protein, partial [Kitasatospora sp. NPDC047058]|uniref:GAP family protein n=1 Tax=Kitasatospora sp. NPDC047058 TaxID=3155620 RepID=UPI0033F061F5
RSRQDGRQHARADPPRRPPSWTGRIDNASLGTAAGLAWLLQPWAMVGAGAATVVDADLSSLSDWLALTGYCLLATLSLLVMELYAVWAPGAAEARLTALRSWLARHQDQLVITLSLLAGLWLTAASIYQLVA